MKINNRGLLIIIAVALVGIFGVVLMNANKETSGDKIGDSMREVIDNADEGIDEFKEEVKDEIDDNTDSR